MIFHELLEIKKLGRQPRCIHERDCFVHNGSFFAARIGVYENGRIYCWGWMDRDEFLEKTKSKWITVDIPKGITKLRICNQDFDIKQSETKWNHDRPKDGIKIGDLMFIHKWITQEDFIKDILDSVYIANGGMSASEECYKAYLKYLDDNSEDNKEDLRRAYHNVPRHNRIYVLGDQDLKDFSIKDIIGAQK